MSKIITLGETMAVLIAQEAGPIEDCNRYTKGVAGAEMNIAIGVSRLGIDCTYVTRLGEDPFGLYIANFLRENDLLGEGITIDPEFLTGMYLKSKVLEGDPSVHYYRKNSAAAHLCPEDIEAISFEDASLLHLTGITPALSQDCYEACEAAIAKARTHGVPISFDPNIRPALWPDTATMRDTINYFISQSDIVLPGIKEGTLLAGKETSEDIAHAMLAMGPHTVIVKLGEAGGEYYTADEHGYVPGYRVDEVVDTVGAGDAFASGVLSGYLAGLDWEACVRRGNAMGAIIITSESDNAALPTSAALEAYMASNADNLVA